MKEIGLYQAKTQFSALVALIEESGEIIALTRHGKVVAELHPPTLSSPKRGCLKSKSFRISDDFDSEAMGFEDFWETKPEPLLEAETGKPYRIQNKNAR